MNVNKIIVIGDAMIDTYVYGKVERISPESPVPVICPEKTIHCLGGAANVARNISSLGAQVTAMFLVGKDKISDILITQLKDYNVDCENIIQDESQLMINKIRIVGNKQQIVRIDYHDKYMFTKQMQTYFINKFADIIDKHDTVVISDYNKGICTLDFCQKIIALCKEKNKPVIVDPKGISWEKYRGSTILTPNMKELNAFYGEEIENDSRIIENVYKNILDKTGSEYLLLTRSECGMTLFAKNRIMHIPAETREVYDVSGAGDTVVATLAASLNTSLDNVEEAVYISNVAAGIVVAKPGTAVVTKEEIQDKLPREVSKIEFQKIYTISDYDSIQKQIRLWKSAGERIITTNGCFDIVHRGHIRLLEEARKMGDRLIVAINSDISVKRLKGESRPINSEMDRAYVISALKSVDAVVIFDPYRTPYILSENEKAKLSKKAMAAADEAPMYILNLIRPDIHIKGGDYKIEDIPEAIFSKHVGFVSFVEGYSTTNTIHKIDHTYD